MTYWASEVLLTIGDAHVSRLAPLESEVPDTAEYLVVVRSDTPREDYLDYFSQPPEIQHLGESIYPSTERVAISIPVGTSLEALKQQPFVRMVVRNYPFFFCH